MYFTITFRSFTPQPGGLEFLPGHDYYFVSTSTGDLAGLHQRVGGRCATHNMKVIFKVCCSPSKGTSSSHQTSTVNVSVPASAAPNNLHKNTSARPAENKSFDRSHLEPASVPPSTLTTAPRWVLPVPTSRMPPHYPRPYEVPIEDEMDKSPPSDKIKEAVEKMPKRDRAKNEELVNGAAPFAHRWYHQSGAYYFVVACLLHHLLLGLLFR
ncbi:Ephrin-B1, partial [Stegodyphus mimosarum]